MGGDATIRNGVTTVTGKVNKFSKAKTKEGFISGGHPPSRSFPEKILVTQYTK